jgi:sugar/nucleoside kinase (ribokinase family)
MYHLIGTKSTDAKSITNMIKPIFDILVAGEINPDLILSGDVVPVFDQVEKLIDSAVLTIGSSSVIFACAAVRLGLKVAFVGVCGDDIFGKYMLAEMQKRGVDVSSVGILSGQKTGISIILARKTDRAILTFPGLISALTSDAVTNDLLVQSRHLHVGSFFLQTALQDGLPDLFDRAHGLGVTISLDPNWDPSGSWSGFEDLLKQVDVFLPNENEALALTGVQDRGSAIKKLSHLCGLVTIKSGKQGAIARRGKETIFLPALPVEVVDTVGAGDTFDAGFLFGYINGWGLERSLRLAISCGSLSTRAAGGTVAQPTLEEAMEYAPFIG